MGPVGVQEMIVIFLVALVLFGPKKLPELGKTIGKAITEFRRAQSELKSTFETHMRELEKENDSVKQLTKGVTDEIYSHYTGYDASYYESAAFGSELKPATDAAALSTSATPASEPGIAQEAPVNGTVPRSTMPIPESEAASAHAALPAAEVAGAHAAEPDSHSAHS